MSACFDYLSNGFAGFLSCRIFPHIAIWGTSIGCTYCMDGIVHLIRLIPIIPLPAPLRRKVVH